jgi:Domain of unknown function (DUF397)
MEGVNWWKSSYSGGASGNCAEVAAVAGTVLVRDSKNPDGPCLAFGHSVWEAFAVSLRAGERC